MKKENIRPILWVAVILIVAEGIFLYDQQSEIFEPAATPELSVNYWKLFAGITQERRYIEEVGAHYRIPVFTPELLDLSGKEVTLSGYFLPYSRLDSVIIISRFPNASCFYCGMAGIESVAMVEMGRKDPPYRMDQLLLVTGKLSLNSTNVNKLAFVLEEATIEEL